MIWRTVPSLSVSAPGRGLVSSGEDFHPATQRAMALRRHAPSPRVQANWMFCRIVVFHRGKNSCEWVAR